MGADFIEFGPLVTSEMKNKEKRPMKKFLLTTTIVQKLRIMRQPRLRKQQSQPLFARQVQSSMQKHGPKHVRKSLLNMSASALRAMNTLLKSWLHWQLRMHALSLAPLHQN